MGARSSKSLEHHTKEEIGAIVASYGLKYESHAKEIVANGIDGELLASFTEEDLLDGLDELGITARLQRRKLVHVFRWAIFDSASRSVSKKNTQRSSASSNFSSSLGTVSDDDTCVSDNDTAADEATLSFGPLSSLGLATTPPDEESLSSLSSLLTQPRSVLDDFKVLLQRQSKENECLLMDVQQLELLSKSCASSHSPPKDRATIVRTDVEGSTALWEANPRAMRQALELHDMTLRSLRSQTKGYEIDTEGDAFFLAFHQAADAVSFALSLQQALNEAPWSEDILALPPAQHDPKTGRRGLRVRVAISVGEVQSHLNPVTGRTQYAGPAWDIAKHIEGMTKGGQILTTDQTFEEAVKLLDVGHLMMDFPKVNYLGPRPVSWGDQSFDQIIEIAPAKFQLMMQRHQQQQSSRALMTKMEASKASLISTVSSAA